MNQLNSENSEKCSCVSQLCSRNIYIKQKRQQTIVTMVEAGARE